MEGGGYLGVALFFMLGGFCMTLGYYDKVQKESFKYKSYALRRASKFYPLHWLCTIFFIAIALASSQRLCNFGIGILNCLLLQSWIPEDSVYFSLNGISWYLSDTIFFTLAFPFIIKHIVSKSRTRNIKFIIILVVLYTSVCILTPEDKRHAILYIHPLVRIVDFIIGIYFAKAFMQKRDETSYANKRSYKFYIFAILCLAFLIFELKFLPNMVGFAFIFWIPAAILIYTTALAGTVRCESSRAIDFLSKCGDYTLSFYLIHHLVITVCNSIAHKIHFEYHFWVMIITLAITCICAYLCRKYFEIPVSQSLNKRLANV